LAAITTGNWNKAKGLEKEQKVSCFLIYGKRYYLLI
jgi:hypothetical protein